MSKDPFSRGEGGPSEKDFLIPNSHLAQEVNSAIIRGEVEGGVKLEKLKPSTRLEVKTQNTTYIIEIINGGEVMISGHPKYCPQPVTARIDGSSMGGSMLRAGQIIRGDYLEFRLVPDPKNYKLIKTSRITGIREIGKEEGSVNKEKDF
ncbi:MAG: hypothetical protein COT91_01320 [Candidatus Doudnabacteria bacterium CG10_big_fil_rev_8_21_14_0_10_41_10]|uniref:Uncharacterized protein n=1 Tax=Candidatus Doudnabacteria bacterium CG10_big_fil_rev_8_21_14_0_10_41_10 TaxID=1974551 RepID=A0A2H0VE95_9BACT|nr:MAG: hypothetical protein COT91_01320 [Candidatus Doudnabacteria bacterium CG10_big_fil_rev_8_21_14_0_10_41_10]